MICYKMLKSTLKNQQRNALIVGLTLNFQKTIQQAIEGKETAAGAL